MRDHDRRAAAHHALVAVRHLALGRRIERGGRLVEHEDAGSARNARAIAIRCRSPAESGAALADDRVVAIGQAVDEARRGRRRAPPRAPRSSDASGRAYRMFSAIARVKDERLLIDERDVAPQIRRATGRADRGRRADDVRDPDRAAAAAGRRSSTCRCRSDRRCASRLAGARRVNDSRSQHRRAAVERQRDVLERDVAATPRRAAPAIAALDHLRRLSRISDTRRSDTRHRRQVGVEAHQRLHRRQQAHLVGHEGDERAERERAVNHAAGRRRRTPRRCRATESAPAGRPTR